MKLTDYLFVLKHKMYKKDNVLLGIILSFLFVGIFSCITMMNFVNIFKSSMINSNAGRTLIIDKTKSDIELKKIRNIKHIDFIESNKYLESIELISKQFDKKNAEGMVQLLPLIKDTDVKIINGVNVEKKGDIICPVNFYPHSLYTEGDYNFETNYFKSYLINANNLIGKSITLEDDNQTISFKIVGTFQNRSLENSSACYISKQDFDNLKGNYEYCSDDICYEYNSLMIRVDNYKYITYVENKLKELGYTSIRYYTFDEELLSSLTYIPLFVGTIVLIISMTIIYSFFRKKNQKNLYQYGILKSIGYSNKDIKRISILEGAIICFISIIISFALYFVGYNVIVSNYLEELSYCNFVVPVPILYMLLFIIIIIIFIGIIINKLIKNSLNSCVQKLFEGV